MLLSGIRVRFLPYFFFYLPGRRRSDGLIYQNRFGVRAVLGLRRSGFGLPADKAASYGHAGRRSSPMEATSRLQTASDLAFAFLRAGDEDCFHYRIATPFPNLLSTYSMVLASLTYGFCAPLYCCLALRSFSLHIPQLTILHIFLVFE